MKKFSTILGIAAAASLTGSSLAGIVSLTVSADSFGSGLYASHDGAKITITLDIDDEASALAGSVTSDWSIEISKGGLVLLKGEGTSSFSVINPNKSGSAYAIESALEDASWSVSDLTPAPTLIQVSYGANDGDLLLAAISNSANSPAGLLTVGTISGSGDGALIGEYTVVPAPSALVLIAGGLVMARRRRA
ncbi:MAG: hypothetical protein EBQ99_09075 [Planctomycetes bacterium]|nr:hypothetical protein [Planctomycetota bacterium]